MGENCFPSHTIYHHIFYRLCETQSILNQLELTNYLIDLKKKKELIQRTPRFYEFKLKCGTLGLAGD